jgi:hypothetical protein
VYAKRGLTLKEWETALCLLTGMPRWHDFAGDVSTLCGSTLRFGGPEGEVHLIHQTARDFLESFALNTATDNVSGLEMSAHAANGILAEICVQFLLINEGFSLIPNFKHDGKLECEAYVGRTLSRRPFLRYAIKHWA